MTDPDIRLFRTNRRGASPGGHYSHAVAAGGFVFVSGQLPIGPDGSKDPTRPIEEQVRLALANVREALAAAGADLHQVVKVTAYLTTEDHWAAFNAVYAEFFGDHRPARAVVPVSPLHYGFLVEVDAVAFVGGAAKA
ncbi:MAG TPA: RidA family protein [Planctomycetota bacterium]|nr:RidA family protein [Planctomycetota bacterium]